MRPDRRAFPRSVLWLSLASALLAVVASAVPFILPSFYARDPDVLAPQLLGQDLVTLVLAAPALAVAAWLASRGSTRAAIVTAGLLLYMAYTYATFALGARFNALFLVYCAILGASTYGLFALVPRLPGLVPAAAPVPRRALAALLYGIVAVFAFLWGMDIVTAWVAGTPPASAAEAETPTSIIHVLDLTFVLPLGALAATLLLRRDDWGIALTGMFLVKGLTIALAVLSMALFAYLADEPVNLPVAGSMLVVVVLVSALGARYFRAIGGTPAGAGPTGDTTPVSGTARPRA